MYIKSCSRSVRSTLLLLAVLLFVLTVPVFGAAEAGPPKYVFYFIGDGMGIAQRRQRSTLSRSRKVTPMQSYL